MAQLLMRKVNPLALFPALLLGLTACSDDKIVEVEVPAPQPTPVEVSYEVTVTNLTNAQPLSPVAVVLHTSGNLWTIGNVSSVELEQLAEGGDNTGLLGLGLVSATGAGPIMPGDQQSISITVQDMTNAKLSVATMLVNTNDGFSGLNAWDLGQLALGDSWMTTADTYDAGTEVNSEAAGSIPGPADGGEGFNPIRMDTGYVSKHPGVVSADDGLTGSVLSSQHKFDNPAIHIQILRTQ